MGFRVPLDEPVIVAWGGATTEVNYHVFFPDQPWAYDLTAAVVPEPFRVSDVVGDPTNPLDIAAFLCRLGDRFLGWVREAAEIADTRAHPKREK